jgi:hypothetical protein
MKIRPCTERFRIMLSDKLKSGCIHLKRNCTKVSLEVVEDIIRSPESCGM